MKPSLCISFRFIQPYPLFHGRADGNEPEWPPSPLRAFQALLNAECLRTRGKPLPAEVRSALQVMEVLRPTVIAPRATLCTIGHRAYVPHNHADLVAAAWDRGKLDASIASHRVEKDHRPYHIKTIGDDLPTLHYVYPLDATNADPAELLHAIRPAVRSIHCLGWGIDQVIADATLVESTSHGLTGERWAPTPRGGTRLRVHRNGSLDALTARHGKFLSRLVSGDWTPVPPLTAMDQVRYRRDSDPIPRPHAAFELLHDDGSFCRYSQRKLMHIAGMVRHLAKKLMQQSPPAGVPDDWVERYVVGHRNEDAVEHRQFSYLPLPSIGHKYADQAVRRVMIAAPVGDDVWLEHLVQRLTGRQLKPENGNEFGELGPPILVRVYRDNVARCYTAAANRWASVTPVILPGHDDRKPAKTRKLIDLALAQSSIDLPCTYEWSAFSHFRNSLSAHKYDRDKRPIYLRPGYLQELTAVHLTLSFEDELKVPGPLVIGAGRHGGFGLMAGID